MMRLAWYGAGVTQQVGEATGAIAVTGIIAVTGAAPIRAA
jgi:hypothetical protein